MDKIFYTLKKHFGLQSVDFCRANDPNASIELPDSHLEIKSTAIRVQALILEETDDSIRCVDLEGVEYLIHKKKEHVRWGTAFPE